MKTLKTIKFLLICTSALMLSCSADKELSKVDEEGLTKEIRNIVPDSILDVIKSMGMPIYGGAHPPLLVKSDLSSYFVNPRTMQSTSVPNDQAHFLSETLTFREQDNKKLTILMDYVSYHTGTNSNVETGSGLGSFIVGNDCQFTVFTQNISIINGSQSKSISVISGSLFPHGIENLHSAGYMVDDNGDPQNVFIENGQGRVIYDTDGFSERIGADQWYDKLPDCPCTFAEVKKLNETICPLGKWKISGPAEKYFTLPFHYGAVEEARWTPTDGSKPGQQCTYKNGKLITKGLAAGTVDFVAPGPITDNILSYEHTNADIVPWRTLPCIEYIVMRPSNQGAGCSNGQTVSDISNEINDTDLLKDMIGQMTCEKAILLIKNASENYAGVNTDLRNYIIGKKISMTRQECIAKLFQWKLNINCDSESDLCGVIQTAINNLD